MTDVDPAAQPTPSTTLPAPPAPQAAPQPPAGDPQLGAIELKTSYFALAFLLALFPAKSVIDGGAELAHGWGTRVYPIPAGQHSVRVWCPYLGFIKMGDHTQVVDVAPGQVTALQWKAPWLAFIKGTWIPLGSRPLTPQDLQTNAPTASRPAPPTGTQPPPPATATPPAGWQPDPQGQATYRYWDGQQWTDHTSNGESTP